MKKLISLLVLGLMLAAPSAAALTADEARECQALANSFGPAKAAVNKKVAERDALAEATEAAGEAWENAENVRTLSAEAAAEADELRAVWEEKKVEFNALESDLFTQSTKLNKDLARFNYLCVTE